MSKRRGLGRGLGALIPTAPATAATAAQTPSTDRLSATTHDESEPAAAGGAGEVVGAHFAELPLSAVRPNPRQPRQVFDAEALAELVASIAEVGLLQPVVVRPATTAGPAEGSGAADTYELVMGERRWRACQEAGLTTIPAIVRETADDVMLRDALLENLHRSQLNPLEEGAAYQQLLDDFGCTHEELAGRLGRSRPQITNTLRLLRLPPPVQRRVAAGVLTAGHARALVSVGDPAVQERLANRTVAEGLSVRALEEIVSVRGSDDPERTTGRRTGSRQTVMAPGLEALADRLSERYDTRVRVQLGKRKGRISVEFASLEDLQRIVALLEPPAVVGSPGSPQ